MVFVFAEQATLVADQLRTIFAQDFELFEVLFTLVEDVVLGKQVVEFVVLEELLFGFGLLHDIVGVLFVDLPGNLLVLASGLGFEVFELLQKLQENQINRKRSQFLFPGRYFHLVHLALDVLSLLHPPLQTLQADGVSAMDQHSRLLFFEIVALVTEVAFEYILLHYILVWK